MMNQNYYNQFGGLGYLPYGLYPQSGIYPYQQNYPLYNNRVPYEYPQNPFPIMQATQPSKFSQPSQQLIN